MPLLILACKVAYSQSRQEGKVRKVTIIIGLKHNNKVKQIHEHQHIKLIRQKIHIFQNRLMKQGMNEIKLKIGYLLNTSIKVHMQT